MEDSGSNCTILVVATRADELGRLEAIEVQARINGVEGLCALTGAQALHDADRPLHVAMR